MTFEVRRMPRLSAVISASLSLLAAGAFLAATLPRDYGWGARLGGAAWVFTLSSIILMPIVPGVVRRALGEGRARGTEADQSDSPHRSTGAPSS